MRRSAGTLLAPLLIGTTAGLAPPADAVGPVTSVTVTFDYNGTDGTDGTPQTWTVPPRVHEATVVLNGASGGDSTSSTGGHGAVVTATLAVQPGQRYTVVVGGQAPGGGSALAGYNGGGGSTSTSDSDPTFGAGGGGATDLRAGTAAGQRLIVAGGGGGAGGPSETTGPPAGGAGGDAGANGQDASPDELAGGGGGGFAGCAAGQTPPPCAGGGAAGAGEADDVDGSGLPGSPLGHGGDIAVDLHAGWGGGGGGGWYGGGSGGSGGYHLEGFAVVFAAGGGGGGGGSSFVTPGALASDPTQLRADAGHGSATITFTPAPDTDEDGVEDAQDRCETLAGSDLTGCPVLDRRLGIAYHAGPHRFRGRLTSTATACIGDRKVVLWRAVPGPDRRVATTTTRADGSWGIKRRLRLGAPYYVRTPRVVVPDVGVCPQVASRNLKRVKG